MYFYYLSRLDFEGYHMVVIYNDKIKTSTIGEHTQGLYGGGGTL